MRERLEKFIKMEGLTPSRFAEIMGVQPSSISHLLGGRNKPSYDFIEKMLLRFPKVNPDWLILGKGNIYRESPDGFKISDSQRVKNLGENLLINPVDNFNFGISGNNSEVQTQPQSTFYFGNSEKKSMAEAIDLNSRITAGEQTKSGSEAGRQVQRGTDMQAQKDMSAQRGNNDIEQIIVFFGDKSYRIFR